MTHYRKLGPVALSFLACVIACGARLHASDADLLLKNGRIWTGDPASPWAEAVAIRGSRILAVGNNNTVADQTGAQANVIDLRGRLAIPGFHEAAAQFLAGSLALSGIDLTGACSLAEMQARVRDYAAAHPKEPWLTGSGWQPDCFPDHRLPLRQDLDAVVRDRPVFLRSADSRAAWVNSRALQLAGITAQTHYAGLGQIVTDPKTNEPTGCLKDSAQRLVSKVIPDPPRAHKLAALEQTIRLAASLGITSIDNAGGDPELVSLFDELDREKKLTLRVNLALTISPAMLPDTVERIVEMKQTYRSPRFHVAGARFVLDGSVPLRTAALLAPYSDAPASSGRLDWTPEAYQSLVAQCDAAGLQVVTRAAGDRAVHLALDAYDYARRENGPRDARWRIDGIETIAPADVLRLGRLGVISAAAPAQALAGPLDEFERAIGPERLKFAYPWASIEASGARVIFSSGWPLDRSLDPIRAIYAAVNRLTPDRKPAGGWVPAQKVGVEIALRAFTVDAAYASFAAKRWGQIRAGMLADIVVLSRDLFETSPLDLNSARVDMTIFDGKILYNNSQP
jgi:predicted amidohydrolase YtcJ